MKHFFVFTAYAVWEWWLGKTKRFIENSTIALLAALWKLSLGKLKGQLASPKTFAPSRTREIMEKDIKVGQVGDLDLKASGGKVAVVASAELPAIAAQMSLTIEIGADVLVDKLKALIESKSAPGVVVVEEVIFSTLKAALMAL